MADRRSAHPSIRVSEAKLQTPDANAPREREGLFDIVRLGIAENGLATSSALVVPAKAGTHNHGLWLLGPGSPPASRASAGTTIFHKNEKPTCGCGKRSLVRLACFRPVIYRERRNSNVLRRQRAGRNGNGAKRWARSQRAALAQHVERDAVALDRRRYPAVERDQQQNVANFVRRAAVGERAVDVDAKLVGAPAVMAIAASDFVLSGSAGRLQISP